MRAWARSGVGLRPALGVTGSGARSARVAGHQRDQDRDAQHQGAGGGEPGDEPSWPLSRRPRLALPATERPLAAAFLTFAVDVARHDSRMASCADQSESAPPDQSPERLKVLTSVLVSHGVDGHTTPPEIDAELARVVAERMQMLAAPSRVQILGHLKQGPCSVGVLAEAVGMESSAVSHQLRALRHLGLVVGERRGKQVFYALHDTHVAELLDQAVFHVQHLTLGARQSSPLPAEAS